MLSDCCEELHDAIEDESRLDSLRHPPLLRLLSHYLRGNALDHRSPLPRHNVEVLVRLNPFSSSFFLKLEALFAEIDPAISNIFPILIER